MEKLHEILIVDLDGKQIDHFDGNYVSRIGEEIALHGYVYNVKRVIYVPATPYIKIIVSGPFPSTI